MRPDGGGEILDIRGLCVGFPSRIGGRRVVLPAVDRVDLSVRRGEMVGVVGESGSGKSVMAHTVMRLREHEAEVVCGGEIILDGRDVLSMSEGELRSVRGRTAAAIFQDPMTSLDPVYTIEQQMREGMMIHLGASARAASARARDLLASVGIHDPDRCMRHYPFELSGGMQQRVMIAMALSCSPSLLIADEPTTALDATVQEQILELISSASREREMAVIFISHDLRVVSRICSRVCVMYLGQIVESAPSGEIFSRAAHPYTQGLIACAPTMQSPRGERLRTIDGAVPPLSAVPTGCRSCTRCPHADERCRTQEPPTEEISPLHTVKCWKPCRAPRARDRLKVSIASAADLRIERGGAPLLEIRALTKKYEARRGVLDAIAGGPKRPPHYAVRDLALKIYEGETYGLVGESGCGKTTTGRAVLGLVEPDDGEVIYRGQDLLRMSARERRQMRREIQTVFQDPLSTLDPRQRIGGILEDPLELHGISDAEGRRSMCIEALLRVGLSEEHCLRWPHELSGGQAQRVGIARALLLSPKLVICDEAVSALDVSIQAQMLNMLGELKREMGLSLMFISHDISVVRYMSDVIGVMYRGRLVEEALTDDLLLSPAHPYTRMLLQSVRPRGDAGDSIGDGCALAPRCPDASAECRRSAPQMREIGPSHKVACHKAERRR